MKSDERVRDLGEVFTPNATIQQILDLLPASAWEPHPSPTFLEPACGNGNFLVAVLDRKLGQIALAHARRKLPAGKTVGAAQYHGLEALASIYAVDISIDNVIGDVSGHEIGARTRLMSMFANWNLHALGKRLTDRSPVCLSADWIVEHNILVGNMLQFTADGEPTGRDDLPLVDYTWSPETRSVCVEKTTLGAVVSAEESKAATLLRLFGPVEPQFVWRGKASSLNRLDRVAGPALTGPARNGNGGRHT